MKRVILAMAALLLVGALGGCAGGERAQSGQEAVTSAAVSATVEPFASAESTPDASQPQTGEQQESKVLVAGFSATGNTAAVAEHIQAILDADYFAIEPQQPYTAEDLDYGSDGCRADLEQSDPDARPAISALPEHPEQYDVLFLGYPIWWGSAPRVICTFLEGGELDGVTIVPFCTSGSSGIGSSAEELQPLAPQANWLEGQRFAGGASRQEVADWIQELALFSQTDPAI